MSILAERAPAHKKIDDDRSELVLSELRAASLRARCLVVDLDTIGIALRGGLITPERAVSLLAEIGVLPLIAPEPREAA
jgi:hypothetical protein